MQFPFAFRSQSMPQPVQTPTALTSDEPARTLLPGPIASIVSLATATGSLSIKVGGFIGHLAINTGRVGALSGVEISRAILESVLFRAGQDVLDSSTGEVGRAAAENALESTLSTIHHALTNTSFLVSAGFRFGSSSLSAGIGLSHALCTAIDAICGDTESSKAIAAIVVMVQREFSNPLTGIERVNLLDILSGSIGFLLLQRWSREKTEYQLKDLDAIEAVWDIVVVDNNNNNNNNNNTKNPIDTLYDAPPDLPSASQLKEQTLTTRRSSLVSATCEEDALYNPVVDDAASVNSLVSARHLGASAEVVRPEQAFRRHLAGQLQPGTSIRVNTQSLLKNTVTIEIRGDQAPEGIDPPEGYTLVAVQSMATDGSDRKKCVFQASKKRLRKGSFEIPEYPILMPSTSHAHDPGSGMLPQALLAGEPGPHTLIPYISRPTSDLLDNKVVSLDSSAEIAPLASQRSTTEFANGDPSREESELEKTGKRNSFKNTIKRGTPYNKLIDFWNHSTPAWGMKSSAQDRTTLGADHSLSRFGTTRDSSPDQARGSRSRRGSVGKRPSVDLEQRPGSRESFRTRSIHRRGGSSIYNLQTNGSDTSLVLHSDSKVATRERLAQTLSASGRLAGQFPSAPFAQNVSRFARFSVAAYGSSFLRFMGAAVEQQPRLVESEAGHHLEHRSYSQYAGLPSSTILLSSFVDPEGGASIAGSGDGALPLIHFISVDHESKAVIIACRGTLGFEDVLTDMTCAYDELHWRGKTYQVHKGMLASARRLITIHGGRLIATVKAALEEFSDYGLILCGHSLGGGVAAVLGILIAQPNTKDTACNSAFVTSTPASQPSRPDGAPYPHPADALALTLPPNRPIHVYAFGPAATMSPALSIATRELITSVINNGDIVPYLCLGNLRDLQAIALSFKKDTRGAKAEVRRRVWDGLKHSLTATAGLGAGENFFARNWQHDDHDNEDDDDEWPWQALQEVRECMVADKLVPPGECFIIERRAVLQRLAFTDAAGKDAVEYDGTKRAAQSFRPASQIRVTHVKDPAVRFSELRFQASMFLDHMPARYERMLEALEIGVG